MWCFSLPSFTYTLLLRPHTYMTIVGFDFCPPSDAAEWVSLFHCSSPPLPSVTPYSDWYGFFSWDIPCVFVCMYVSVCMYVCVYVCLCVDPGAFKKTHRLPLWRWLSTYMDRLQPLGRAHLAARILREECYPNLMRLMPALLVQPTSRRQFVSPLIIVSKHQHQMSRHH